MKIVVNGLSASLIKDDTLIQKSEREYTVDFEFDDSWTGYEKSAVFAAGNVSETVVLVDDSCTIPSSVLEDGGVILKVRVHGTKESVEMNTEWCDTSRILYRVDMSDIPEPMPTSNAIRSGELVDHIAKFYTTPDMSGDPAFTLDFPEEMFLDQTKTQFVADFVWSTVTYPGSTNPNLDGKPVFVLAVKGEDPTANPSYSFVNMQLLVDVYTGGSGDGSATVTVSGYEISVNVNLSANAGNIITKDASGKLYAAHQDISGKADKDANAVEGNFAAFDANGNPVDSGHKHGDYLTAHQDISGKMDKPSSAVEGNLAKFNGSKEAVDSGVALGDVQQKLAAASFTAGNVRTSDANGFAQDSGISVSSLLQGEAASDAEVNNMLDEVFT